MNTLPPPPPSDVLPPPPPPPPSDFPPPPPPSTLAAAAPPPPPPATDFAPPPPPEDADAPPSIAPKSLKRKVQTIPKKQPLGIEEILRKKKEADEAAAKPKFLSKAQREKLALEKRQKEADEQRRRIDAERAERVTETTVNRDAPEMRNGGSNGHNYSQTNGNAKGSIPTGPRALRKGEQVNGQQNGNGNSHIRENLPNKGYDMQPPAAPKVVATGKNANAKQKMSEEEAAAVLTRQRYMGAEQNQSTFSALKKRKRTTDKKFNFEWNAEEDTSTDYNPLYQQRTEANFFGRGRLGGFAEETVDGGIAKYAAALEERDGEAGRQRALEMFEMERRRREEGSRNALDKHWSEKPLTSMRERDWRIFKEDFNISTKGGTIPNPMRSWSESGLPQNLLSIVSQVGYTDPSAVPVSYTHLTLPTKRIV